MRWGLIGESEGELREKRVRAEMVACCRSYNDRWVLDYDDIDRWVLDYDDGDDDGDDEDDRHADVR